MFVDASAIVAILTDEPERATLLAALDRAEVRLTSPIAVFETVVAVSRKLRQPVGACEDQVSAFLAAARIGIVGLAEREGTAALAAFARYGKGRGHPAQLNIGDCFAYACARSHDVPLLFVGDNFSRTDIPSAQA